MLHVRDFKYEAILGSVGIFAILAMVIFGFTPISSILIMFITTIILAILLINY